MAARPRSAAARRPSGARRPSPARLRPVAPLEAGRPCTLKYPPRRAATLGAQAVVPEVPAQAADGGQRVTFGRSPGLVYPPTGWRPSPEGPVGAALVRDHVYGYDGSCSRSLCVLSDRECAYPLAALCVVAELGTNRQRFFEGHTNDVRSLGWNPARRLCASGQVDPKGKGTAFVAVWDPYDCSRTISRLMHPADARAVAAVAFSPDGNTIVSFGSDKSMTLHIWRDFAKWDGRTSRARREELAALGPAELFQPFYAVTSGQQPTDGIFMAPSSGGDGRTLTFYSVGPGEGPMQGQFRHWTVTLPAPGSAQEPQVAKKLGTYGKSPAPKSPTWVAFAPGPAGGAWLSGDNGFFYSLVGPTATHGLRVAGAGAGGSATALGCVTALPDGSWLAGAGDGALYIGVCDPGPRIIERILFTDLDGDARLFVTTTQPRLNAVRLLSGQLALFGTANHALILVDLARRHAMVLQVSHAAETLGGRSEVWAADFHPGLSILATGSTSRDVRFWNVAERRPAVGRVLRGEHPVWCLAFSRPCFQQSLSRATQKGKERVTDVRFSNVGDLLAAACSDRVVYLLRVIPGGDGVPPQVDVHCMLHGNTSAPLCVSFSADGAFVMTNSRDTQILVWRSRDGTRQKQSSAFRDTRWQEPWTGVLGWPVIGIWGDPEYDQTDINSACQAYPPHDNLLAIGDDMGRVKLFNFPSPYLNAACLEYGGHASHVTRVVFSRSNTLVALGGDDCSISQWSLAAPPDFDHSPPPAAPPGRGREGAGASDRGAGAGGWGAGAGPEAAPGAAPAAHPWALLEDAAVPRDRFFGLGRPAAQRQAWQPQAEQPAAVHQPHGPPPGGAAAARRGSSAPGGTRPVYANSSHGAAAALRWDH
ncbi:unnamed protein product [Prorocentrum cordatum]|uniref:EML-like second beta-propeller domain-containing protein n=1 Tax=Prorocentrum cordatum TaxID=2364126 RepID=A0ABN9SWF5_9DINO|nr:unnamed protein product [Polarella glacialis]